MVVVYVSDDDGVGGDNKVCRACSIGNKQGLALGLSFMSSTMVSILFVSTFLHAFVWRTLFPNDLAIAITKRKHGKEKKPLKKVYDIKRWTKKALTKNNTVNEDTAQEKTQCHT